MFLGLLTQEAKIKFLEFVYLIANADGDYAEEEQEVIRNYQMELNISDILEITDSMDDLLEFFSNQPEEVKKIVIFEIYGLIISDRDISLKEQNILDAIDNSFGIDSSKLNEIKDLVSELQGVYEKIYDVLM